MQKIFQREFKKNAKIVNEIFQMYAVREGEDFGELVKESRAASLERFTVPSSSSSASSLQQSSSS